MTDREKAGLLGPVRTVRHHRGMPATVTVEWFNPQGARVMTENEYGDGAVSQTEYVYDGLGRLRETRSDDDDHSRTYEYDTRGRLVRVWLEGDEAKKLGEEIRYQADGRKSRIEHLTLPDEGRSHGYRIEGTDQFVLAQGATTVTTNYDTAGHPVEVLAHNAEKTLLLKTVLRCDPAGRVIEMVNQVGDTSAFTGVPEKDGLPAEMRSVFEQVFAPGSVMGRTSFAYDESGRCVEQISSDPFIEASNKSTYDEHGNRLTEVRYEERHDIEIDDSGHIVGADERNRSVFETRFEYEYDERGNWTKCTTYVRGDPAKDFTNSGVEHRTITYY